ncbi:flavin reductase family protein [Corynebacterium sp. zg-331]|uniref:flavin reductase family protein n=1 Tax=unclassified Corynebacterium TaxID=2624378 RepID=UPI00128BFF59|nr:MULTISPECIES: flavin reductase family protein [unclassified Corynebacterium]MBC3185817.1 flavin reductase family protein [Corynebacterium sp. zg-331]MPV52309.1 flavin reductase [Corynebacterium sp. zg331]
MTTSTTTPDLSPAALRHTFGAFPTGIALIAANLNGKPTGMLASSFTTTSLQPPLAHISFDKSSTTWPSLRTAPLAGISILSTDNHRDIELLRRPTEHRFDGMTLTHHPGDALTLPNAIATFLVSPHEDIDTGDHITRFFRILEHSRRPNAEPLVFHNSAITALQQD